MKILITGTRGLATALVAFLDQHEVTCVSRSTGYDIGQVIDWAEEFQDFDMVVNCAFSGLGQVEVLKKFSHMWQSNTAKSIINIGSTVTSYPFSTLDMDHTYSDYRLLKIALQHAFEKIVRTHDCHVQLINPGLFPSDMTVNNNNKKMPIDQVAKNIHAVMFNKQIKRVDLWD